MSTVEAQPHGSLFVHVPKTRHQFLLHSKQNLERMPYQSGTFPDKEQPRCKIHCVTSAEKFSPVRAVLSRSKFPFSNYFLEQQQTHNGSSKCHYLQNRFCASNNKISVKLTKKTIDLFLICK